MKIAYKNVCSMRDVQVEFKPGTLTCIMGETNQGKSALFYSLVDGLLNRPLFKTWINNKALQENPQATAWIGLTDDEGNLWQVEAGKKHVYFRLNEAKYEKVGRKTIFEVTGQTIPKFIYDPENTSPIMNILDEDSGMFPIDRSDSQIFKTYERLLSLSCTEDILRTMKLDADEVDFKISEMTTSIQKKSSQVAGIEDFFIKMSEDSLATTRLKIIAYRDILSKLTNLCTTLQKPSEYVAYVNSKQFKTYSFDTNKFKTSLENLVKANSDRLYVLKALNVPVQINHSIDLEKIKQVSESYVKANQIQKEIESLNSYIEQDKSKLNEIESILKTIKVCPLCGKPMEN